MPGSAFDGLSAAQFAVCQFICKAVREAYDLKISFEQPDALKIGRALHHPQSGGQALAGAPLRHGFSLRDSIGLRAYGQRDPLIEYKAEAFKVFEELMTNIKTEICHNIFRSASSLMAFDEFHAQHAANDDPSGGFRRFRRQAPPATAQADGKKASDMVTEATERDGQSQARPHAAPKSDATTLVPAAAGKNTSIAAGKTDDQATRSQMVFK